MSAMSIDVIEMDPHLSRHAVPLQTSSCHAYSVKVEGTPDGNKMRRSDSYIFADFVGC